MVKFLCILGCVLAFLGFHAALRGNTWGARTFCAAGVGSGLLAFLLWSTWP